MEANEDERKRVVEGHMQLFAGMHPPASGTRAAIVEAPMDVPALESHFDFRS